MFGHFSILVMGKLIHHSLQNRKKIYEVLEKANF